MRNEYMLRYREAHREIARERERLRRAGPTRDRVLAAQRASYWANREERLARSKDYREKNWGTVYAGIRRWKQNNPEKNDMHMAKVTLAKEMGVRFADVPDDLAEARVAQWLLKRSIKEMSPKGE